MSESFGAEKFVGIVLARREATFSPKCANLQRQLILGLDLPPLQIVSLFLLHFSYFFFMILQKYACLILVSNEN